MTELQHEQPSLYADLTKTLSPEEQQTIQAAVNQADQIAVEAQQAAAAAAAAAAGGVVPAEAAGVNGR